MAACGIPEAEMVQIVINPKTRKPISLHTLRAHFRAELDRGMLTTNMKVMAGMYKNATTPTVANPGGNPILQIFWAKVRLGWKDRQTLGLDEGLPAPVTEDEEPPSSTYEFARRIAFALDAATRKAPPALAAPKKREPA